MSDVVQTLLPRSTPEEQGVSSAGIAAFVAALDAEVFSTHSYMVLRHGHVIAEGWWEPYTPQQPHAMFSVSKAVTATAIGIAVAEGRFSVDDTVISLLPDDAPANPSPNLAAMTLRHLLTMTTGHSGDTTGRARESRDPDWAKVILALDVEEEPGSRFVYDTGATFLMSAILQRATGQRMLDYLGPRLFGPLGIEGATWQQSPLGIDVGGFGLSLTTEQLAVFGQLYLQRGTWNGVQLVPAQWVDAATSNQVPTVHDQADWMIGYGYQFWRGTHNTYRGDGAFGQIVSVIPDLDAVLVFTSGVQNSMHSLELAWEHLLPALEGIDPAGPKQKARTDLALPTQPGAPTGIDIDGLRLRFVAGESNPTGVHWARLEGSTLTIVDAEGEHTIDFGFGEWRAGTSTYPYGMAGPVAASAAWIDDNTWVGLVWALDGPFRHRIELAFNGDAVTLDLSANITMGPAEIIHPTGAIER